MALLRVTSLLRLEDDQLCVCMMSAYTNTSNRATFDGRLDLSACALRRSSDSDDIDGEDEVGDIIPNRGLRPFGPMTGVLQVLLLPPRPMRLSPPPAPPPPRDNVEEEEDDELDNDCCLLCASLLSPCASPSTPASP